MKSMRFSPVCLLLVGLVAAGLGYAQLTFQATPRPPVLPHPRTYTIDGLAFSPDGKTLAYCCNRDGVDHQNLFLIRLAEPDAPRQLTRGKQWVSYPVFSPDGNTLVCTLSTAPGQQQLYSLSTTGGAPALLPGQGGDLTWCASFFPDGKRLAYASSSKGLVVQQLDGKLLRTIPLKLTWALDLDVSPAGDRIAFRATRFKLQAGRVEGPFVNVSVVKLATGTVTPLTDWAPLGQGDWAVRWLPDGQHVVILSRRGSGSIFSDFYKVPASGGSLTPLAQHTRPGLARFAIAPAGDKLAFVRNDAQRAPQIWLLELATGKLSQLTHFKRPDWANKQSPALPGLTLPLPKLEPR